MRVIKQCPMCMSNCTIFHDQEKNIHILECPKCKENGITIRLEDEDYDKLLDKWNHRAIEDFILKHPEESVMFLKLLNGEYIDPNIVKKTLNTFDYVKIDVDQQTIPGYLEDLEGNVFVCEQSHIDTLLNSLGMEDFPNANQTTLDAIVQRMFTERGFVKISTQAKCMMLEINFETINKKQVDGLINFVSQPENIKNVKVYYVDLFDCKENCKIEVFYNVNDLILFLDKLD